MLDSCLNGQAGIENPHLFSSETWLAHEAGRELSAVSAVKACRMSRGYSVRVETASSIFIVKFLGDDLSRREVNRK